MKQSLPLTLLLLALPSVAHAQLQIILGGSGPELRAGVGPLTVSAGMGSRGLDVRVVGRPATTTRSRRVPAERPRSTTGRTTAPRRTGGRAPAAAGAVLTTADNYIGTRYIWGGATPAGFDCSGYVQYVFRRHGVELPRTSRQQAQVGQALPLGRGSLQPGDLMFFAGNGSRIDHIAIYAGNDQIIHSSSSGGGVGYDRLDSKRGRWYVTHHVATRRVLADGSNLVGGLSDALRAFVGFDPPDLAPRR